MAVLDYILAERKMIRNSTPPMCIKRTKTFLNSENAVWGNSNHLEGCLGSS
jgi:hypothetical protein